MGNTNKIRLSIRDVEVADAAIMSQYWTETTHDDFVRMGELRRPDPSSNLSFIRQLCSERLSPEKAEEGILIWLVDAKAVGYCTLKDIRYQNDAQIHLHMWEKKLRGKGIGAVLFCLSALHFIKLFRLKALYCQPKYDNPMPNKMLRKIGFKELGDVDYRRQDNSVIKQRRYLISTELILRYLASAHQRFSFSQTGER